MSRHKNTREKIAAALRQWYYKHTKELTAIRLTHINGQRRDNLVETFVFPARDREKPLTDGELEVMAEQIECTALDHGDAFPGLQSYKIAALVTGSENPVSSRTFKVEVYDHEAEDTATEPPTEKGLLGQLMRLNESLQRSTILGQLQVQRALGDVVDRLSQRNEHLERRQFETYEMLEKLLSLQHDRELAGRELEARLKHRGEMLAVLKQLGPVVANRIAGGGKGATKLLTAGDSLSDLIRSFIESLSEEQSDQMFDRLVEDQQAVFLDLVKQAATPGANVAAGFRTWAMSLKPQQMGELNGLLTPTQRIQVSEIWRSMTAPASSSKH